MRLTVLLQTGNLKKAFTAIKAYFPSQDFQGLRAVRNVLNILFLFVVLALGHSKIKFWSKSRRQRSVTGRGGGWPLQGCGCWSAGSRTISSAPFTDQQASPQNDLSVGGQSWEQTGPIYSLKLLKLPLSYIINSRHFSQRNFI